MNRYLVRNIPAVLYSGLEEYVQAIRDEDDERAGKIAADLLSDGQNKIRIGKSRISAVSHIRPLAAKRDLYINAILTPSAGNQDIFAQLEPMSVRTGNVTASLEVVPFYDYRDVPITPDLRCESASQLRQLQLAGANSFVLGSLQSVFSVSELELPSWKLYLYGQEELDAEPESPRSPSADDIDPNGNDFQEINAGGRPRPHADAAAINYFGKPGPCFQQLMHFNRMLYACDVKADGNCFIYSLQSLGAVRGTVDQCRQELRMAAQYQASYLQQLTCTFGERFEQVKKFEGVFSKAGIIFASAVFRHRFIVISTAGCWIQVTPLSNFPMSRSPNWRETGNRFISSTML
jgi:hypothetical protein